MRHKHGYRKLGRTSTHRAALLKNLTISIINVGKIETTLPKARASFLCWKINYDSTPSWWKR